MTKRIPDKTPSELFLKFRMELIEKHRQAFAQARPPEQTVQEKAPDRLTELIQLRKEQTEKEEQSFKQARLEYETTRSSQLTLAKKYELDYNAFREHILKFHPESHLLHVYAKRTQEVADYVTRQTEMLQSMGENILKMMSEDLEKALAKMDKTRPDEEKPNINSESDETAL